MRLSGSLYPNEKVLASTRSHESFLLPAAASGFVAVTAYSFASAINGSTVFFGVLGYVLAFVFAYAALKRLWRWCFTGFILTSDRLVVQRGLGGAKSVSLPLGAIEGIDVKVPLVQAGGNVHLRVHSRGTVHVLRKVPRGREFSVQVQQVQNACMSRQYSWGGFSSRPSSRYGY